MVVRLELTVESAKSCRDPPMARLMLALQSLKKGERIEVVGEDLYYKYSLVKQFIVGEGFRIEEEEYDGFFYRIVAVKE